jgi:hypothetical protein
LSTGVVISAFAAGNANNINSDNTSNVSGADVWQYLHTAVLSIGKDANAHGNTAISIGAFSEANSYGAMAVGQNTYSGMYATSVGPAASARGTGSISIGTGSRALSNTSVAIGWNSLTNGVGATAVGDYAKAMVQDSVAVGMGSVATKTDEFSVGHLKGDPCYTMGYGSGSDGVTVSYSDNTWSGNLFRRIVNVKNGTSAHDAATVAQTHITTVGNGLTLETSTNDDGSTKYKITPKAGTNVTINSNGINVTGTGTVTSGNNELVTGGTVYDALQGIGSFGISYVGINSDAGDVNEDGSGAIGDNAIAIGASTVADGDNSIALGYNSVSEGTSTTTLGSGASSSGDYSTSLGTGTVSTGNYSVSVGSFATATGENSIALGLDSYTENDNAIAIGNGSVTTANNSIAIGYTSTVEESDSIAIGNNASTLATSSVSIGANSVNNIENSVSFGNDRLKRRLINIATGIDDTDAVNVSQLNAAIAGVSGGGASYSAGDNISIENNIVSATGLVKYDSETKDVVSLEGRRGTTLTNLKAGAISQTSTDAIIGNQLWSVKQDIIGFASDINRNKANITTLNQSVTDALTSVSAVSDLVDTIDQLKADTSLNNLTAQGKAVINTAAADAVQAYMAEHSGQSNSNRGALGVGITGMYYGINSSSGSNVNGENATATNSIAIGKNAQAGGSLDTIAIGLNAVSKGDGSVVIGRGARADVNSEDTELYDNNFGQVILGYEAITTGDNNKGTVAISSFAEGYDTFQSIAIGHSSFVTGNFSIAMGAGAGGKNVMDRAENQYTDTSKGYFRMDGKAGTGYESVSIGHDSLGFGDNSIALGDHSFVGGNNSVAVGAKSSVGSSSDNVVSFGHKAGDNYFAWDKMDEDYVGAYTDDLKRRLINIEDGIDDNDAVTVGQLNGRVKYDASDKATVTLEGTRGTKLTNLKAAALSRTSTDAVIGSQLYATNQNIVGFAQDINRNKANITTLNQSVTDALTAVSAVSDLVDMVDQLKADASLNNLTARGKTVIANEAVNAVQAYMAEHGGTTGIANEPIKSRLMALTAPVLTADPEQGITQEDLDAKADISYVDNALANKADISDVETLSSTVSNLETNLTGSINALDSRVSNTESALSVVVDTLDTKADKDSVYTKEETDTKLADKADKADLDFKADKSDLDTKADKDASNIDVQAWAEKLGTGEIAEGNTGLVNGGTVYNTIKELGNNNMVQSDGQTISIGKDDTADSVSVAKADGTGRALRGVLVDPEDDTSAVNMGYVNAIADSLADGINNGFARIDDKINKTGAGAAALANLHPVDTDGDTKLNIAAAIGKYHGSTAGALGVFYKPSDRVVMNISSTVGNNDTMFGAGISVAVDKPIANGLSKVQMAKTINAQADEISAIKQSMVEERKIMMNEILSLRKEVQELKAQKK